MKKFILICLLGLSAFNLKAQRIYFIYLQSDPAEPFFARMNDKLYSSTASGYLILSRLKDSVYNFKIGFPGKELDLSFSATINKKDHGYLIKDFGEKGWGLFDLQTLGVQMSSSNIKKTAQVNNSNTEVNAFTDLLSRATGDPSLKQTVVFTKAEEKKPEVVQTVVIETKTEIKDPVISKPEEKANDLAKKDQKIENKPVVNDQEKNKPEEKKIEVTKNDQQVEQPKKEAEIIPKEEVYKRSAVSKVSGVNTTGGFELVFIDKYTNGNKDTIRIVIPPNAETSLIRNESKADSKKEEKKFLDITTDTARMDENPQREIKKDEPVQVDKKEEKKPVAGEVKNNCKSIADQNDFLKLRRKMAARTNDDGMIDEARKYFKTKCFTTEQVRNLSSMFLSSAGKYHFFETSYTYTSDIENFPSLQTELKDEFYINRFKSILRN